MKSGLLFRRRSVVVCLLLLSVLLAACAPAAEETETVITSPTFPSPAQPVETLFFAPVEEEVLLCSESAKKLYDRRLLVSEAVETGDPYRPFRFEYCLTGGSGVFYLGEQSDFSDAKTYPLDPKKNLLTIDNLKTDTVYHYRVESGSRSYSGTFRTARSTRFLSIPGTQNVRDIGGYRNLDGLTVRQGLLIRGGELDGLQSNLYRVSEEDLARVQETFGFVFDMDLRSETLADGAYVSPLGPETKHRFYDAPLYKYAFYPGFRATVREIFRDLANPDNYPMYLHCAWGRDRTGTIVFLLQGVLNMSQADMLREYRLTGFVDSSCAVSDQMDPVIEKLQTCYGDTLQEKIVNYLTNVIQVTDSEIESIRSIFLEGY